MKTKEKIILSAIDLYNEQGLANVTSRQIASKIGISHGNLEYHYPNKEAILIAVYDQMREEISGYYESIKADETDPIGNLQNLLTELEGFQSKYRFFNQDILEITRNYQDINTKLSETLTTRKQQMRTLFSQMLELDLLEHEPHEGYYQRLQHTIRILITFWIPQEVVLVSFDYSKTGEMSRHIWDLILPHLTQKGLKLLVSQLNTSSQDSDSNE